ncbi:Got1/Sft2-like family-domain-containing protein [Dipodascopsis tothii]|uniref:Got1/Sft2-like family-domain-containing protein n=1 Tax=Dipodascopsis tothii TaxID=44089 RepID=UPI0034CDB4DE
MWLSDVQKAGVGLTAAGCFFLALGVLTFFDASLLAFGNILFVAGLTLIIGARKTVYFFSRRQKIRGTLCFGLGILLILMRRSFVGFTIEFFGILGLFGDFFSVIVAFLRSLPLIGPVLSSPFVAPTIDRLAGIRVLPV